MRCSAETLVFQVILQLGKNALGWRQPREGLALDLADALARDAELSADLLERARMAVLEPEAQADDLALSFCKSVEHLAQLLLKHGEACSVGRHDGGIVLDEVAELAVFLFADRGFQDTGSWLIFWISRTRSAVSPIFSPISSGEGLAAKLLKQLTLDADELVNRFDHMHRNTNSTSLVGDSARDGLANPPRCVGGELETLGVIEFLDRANQAKIALLDKVQKQHAAATT